MASGRGIGWFRAAIVFGWLVSVVGCVPAAVIVGIWLSGWEDPGSYMMQGASTNPWLSGAGLATVLTFVVLLVLATLLWSWPFGRLTYRRRH